MATDDFSSSPEITVLKQKGPHRWTRHPKHADFAVWYGNTIVAQGGQELTERIYKERSA
ncbi:hypothetical protein [Rhizobium sp. BK376]|uniref:hypothetical protein n=1 Tax=Rhizobium sp. BK376 TaxID=2512149 RepID=UPI0010CE9490|nr:hypothetical protein [Rhizobium sp. BK376]TCR92614.1 hypothetical protein EV561_10147 [Rhizobium sp. BK376]